MPRNEEARQKSSADISDDIRLIHWTGMIDSVVGTSKFRHQRQDSPP